MKKLRKLLKSIVALILGHLTIFKHSFKKRVTLEYPEVRPNIPNSFRGKHALNTEKCCGCGICTKVCPSGAVEIKKENGKVIEYNIDLGKCIFCGNCQYNCPNQAIILTEKFELATDKKSTLKLDINTLKSNFSDTIIGKEK